MQFELSSYLFRIDPEDKKDIKTLCAAFQDNGRMHALVGKNRGNFSKEIKAVISYCYFMVKKIGGIFKSKDQSTFLLFYRKSEHYFSFRDWLHYLYLAFFVIGVNRIGQVLKREKLIRKTRTLQIQKHQDQDFLYVWFLAQKKDYNGLDGLMEAKEYITAKGATLDLPIYMETTEERLIPIYERFGFEFYDYQEDDSIDLKVWFGRCVA